MHLGPIQFGSLGPFSDHQLTTLGHHLQVTSEFVSIEGTGPWRKLIRSHSVACARCFPTGGCRDPKAGL